jgi:protein-L-isoaspartate O-methyltransferase
MKDKSALEKYLIAIEQALNDNIFVKLTLASYQGHEQLKNIYVKRILIKGENKLSFTYRNKTNDLVKNYGYQEGLSILKSHLENGTFKLANLFTIDFDLSFEFQTADKIIVKKKKPSISVLPSASHDKQKHRIISSLEKSYLYHLAITDEKGNVLKHAQDKYKQINNYVELLSSMLKELSVTDTLNVVDMGAGKGYLTFALYDYLTTVLKLNVNVTGVEFREELVKLCNDISLQSGFKNLHFEQGTIESYSKTNNQVLIALHACDTATDEAIYKGISSNAALIVVAPCCHKQIRRELEKNKVKNELDFLTKYGIFLERQAEMVTDGIRVLIMEYYGYHTKVVEFISDAHTPKNVMLIGAKKKNAVLHPEKLEELKKVKSYLGITQHHLEKLMNI